MNVEVKLGSSREKKTKKHFYSLGTTLGSRYPNKCGGLGIRTSLDIIFSDSKSQKGGLSI